MLVLTRKLYEQIIISVGDRRIVVSVESIHRDKIKLGIDAPQDVTVHRREVQDRITARPGAEARNGTSPRRDL